MKMILHKYNSGIIVPLILITTACSVINTEDVKQKPNIIYILADDLGIGDLSCYGQEKFSTPNIDFLAENGIRFTNHYSGCTVCAPSRSVLMTGLNTGHTPVRGNKRVPLPDSSLTVAEVLKDAGYSTGLFGKWGLGLLEEKGPDSGYPTKQGFDVFFGYDDQGLAHRYYPSDLRSNDSVYKLPGNNGVNTVIYSPEIIQDHALKFIDDNKNHPFFLYYATTIPHVELIAPNDSILKKFKGRFDEIPYKGNDYGAPDYSPTGYCSQDYPSATYAAMISHLDTYVGQIIKKLQEENLIDNTIILFASDNGACIEGGYNPSYFNSTANLRGHKRDLFEGGIRTPFIVYWKYKIVPESYSDHISAFEDVLPTLAEITGSNIPQNIDGISFLPSLLGKKQLKTHDYLYWEFHEQGGKQAIRKDKWKAIRLNVSENLPVPIMLFDLEKDPYEISDISADYPEITKEMTDLMNNSRTENPNFLLFPQEKE